MQQIVAHLEIGNIGKECRMDKTTRARCFLRGGASKVMRSACCLKEDLFNLKDCSHGFRRAFVTGYFTETPYRLTPW